MKIEGFKMIVLILCLISLSMSSQAQWQFNWKGCTTAGLPRNVEIRCHSVEGCTITCLEGYELSNGALDISVKCRDGTWTYLGMKRIPQCKAVCSPGCQNGGKCIYPGFCRCPEQFVGSHCQYPLSSCSIKSVGYDGGARCSYNSRSYTCNLYCADKEDAHTHTCEYSTGVWSPPIINCYPFRVDSQREFIWKKCSTYGLPSWFFPKGSLIHCRSDTDCKVTCPEGYQFSNGTDHLNLQCKDNGMWLYPHVNSDGIPKCQAGCSPNCENGGKCIAPGKCDCPDNFKGSLCQYHLSTCNMTSVDYNAPYNCNSNDIDNTCDLYCYNNGISTHKCEYSTGVWSPTIEKCRYTGRKASATALDTIPPN